MMISNQMIPRDYFKRRIEKGLLGPGSDIFGLPDEGEIISDKPLQRYFTGVLFPEKEISKTESEEDDAKTEAETSKEEDSLEEVESEMIDNFKKSENNLNEKLNKPEQENRINQNHFYPTNMGITICLDKSVEKVDCKFSYGIYYQPKMEETKIAMSKEDYSIFFQEQLNFPLKDILKYKDGFLSLSRPLKGNIGKSGSGRTGEYEIYYNNFKKSENYKNHPSKYCMEYFEKLILRSRIWKRRYVKFKTKIEVKTTETPIIIPISKKSHKELKVGYYTKKYSVKNNNYLKIQLVNLSDIHPAREFISTKEKLNHKCLFQVEIKVFSNKFKPFKVHKDYNPFDKEAEKLNFIYRNIHSYAIGHNCGVQWEPEEKPNKISSTFIPEFDVKDLINKFDSNSFNFSDFVKNILDIYNLSTFSLLPKYIIIKGLKEFIEDYNNWITHQKNQIQNFNENEKIIAGEIIYDLEENYNRLKSSIDLLERNEKIFKCFQLANTTMLIQFIISNDENFSKKEKYLSEINNDIIYDDIDYFKNYNFNKLQLDTWNKRFNYRPFQLAFILINLNGIVNIDSKDRKEIVDLLWFPTGGGKTEAYLAIIAFTIIWRRAYFENEFDGTSVIMRYTLRLLTSQQFERASRLIVTLDFLRKYYKNLLRDKPITIGLWIGMSSTPNSIKEAKRIVKKISEECDKDKKENPESKNVFQITCCPWCGCKLINKNIETGKWIYGFKKIERNSFYIDCLNRFCPFSKRLPVQVVDEMLYKEPPTLLFATVDKFAMLSWVEDGNVFFNSLNDDKLPPDLIIQDELHLLSGPLGSITGIYESIIELLSTKNNRSPKIIASTATTRNTDYQVEQLYGGKKVNIFPPTGLLHNDSFFTREASEKGKRKYIGFIPTGKTALDTQLQLLAHLLVARLEVYKFHENEIDNYWTIVSYYNSLKDVGKTSNKVGDEISNFTSQLQLRLSNLFGKEYSKEYTFNYYGIPNRTEELTGRIESTKIKSVLKKIERNFDAKNIEKSDKGNTFIKSVVDLVLATNMMSVGIDISRLNTMLINGMPRNVAEYIQASSRIGRKTNGLVITLFDPNRSRDKSYFENFVSFHQAFYKSIEPLSITPFTDNTIEKMVASLMVTFVRHKVPGMASNFQVQYFQKEMLDDLKYFIKSRFSNNQEEYKYFEKKINHLANDWLDKIKNHGFKKYDELLKRPSTKEKLENNDWVLMQSMREIDTDTFIEIIMHYI